MPEWTKFDPAPREIEILLFDRFSNHCLANALEPFRAANTLANRQAYRWRLFTPDGSPAVSSSGLAVLPDAALGDAGAGGIALVVSSYGYRDLDGPATRRALRRIAAKSELVVGLDTGAWLMAAAGLLDRRRATIHWDVLDSFAETFLAVDAVKARFVTDGDRLTCGGATTAFELVLDLIGAQQGESLRLDVAALFMHELGAGPSFQRLRARRLSDKSRTTVRAITLMQERVEQPLAIAEIARTLGCTQKHLERRFGAEFGAAPAVVYRHLRLAAARRLVENSDLPIAEVALRCGYSNASAMTRAFTLEFGANPRALRRLAGSGVK